jgi:UDP-glucose 4-epimerase
LILNKAEFTGETINVANGEEVHIKSAVKSFLKFFNKDITFEFNGKIRDCDPLNWKADISSLNLLGYKRSVGFEEGLNKYITWLNEKK